jgi:hypothetical protein
MKIYLLLLASLFSLSSGFMAELRGPLTDEACSGTEYADFEQCVMDATDADLNLPSKLTAIEEKAFMDDVGGQRKLQYNMCGGCRGGAPRGTFCYTYCGRGRRLLEDATDTPDLKRLLEEDRVAIFRGDEYIGNTEAIQVAKDVIECFGGLSTSHPCLGSTDTMTLIIHTTLTSGDELYKSAGCVRGAGRRHYQ